MSKNKNKKKHNNLLFTTEEEKHGVPYLYLCDKNDKCRRINLDDYQHTFLKDGLVNIFTNTVMITGEHKNTQKERKQTPYPLVKQHKRTQKINVRMKKPNQTRRKK